MIYLPPILAHQFWVTTPQRIKHDEAVTTENILHSTTSTIYYITTMRSLTISPNELIERIPNSITTFLACTKLDERSSTSRPYVRPLVVIYIDIRRILVSKSKSQPTARLQSNCSVFRHRPTCLLLCAVPAIDIAVRQRVESISQCSTTQQCMRKMSASCFIAFIIIECPEAWSNTCTFLHHAYGCSLYST